MSYIRGKYAQAACSLIDDLQKKGIHVQVGYPKGTRPGKLVVFIGTGDESDIPSEWAGIPITIGDASKVTIADENKT